MALKDLLKNTQKVPQASVPSKTPVTSSHGGLEGLLSGSTKNTNVAPPIEEKKVEEKKPTLAGEMIRGVVKTPARLLTNLTQAIDIARGGSGTAEPFSGKYLGKVSSVGTADGGGLSWKNLKESVGAGLEMAQYVPIAGGIGTASKVLKGAAPWAKAAVPLAVEGAVSGALGSTGTELQKNAETGQPMSLKNIAMATGIGAVAGPVLGAVAGTVGKLTGLNKLLAKSEQAIQKPVAEVLQDAESGAMEHVRLTNEPQLKKAKELGFISPNATPEAKVRIQIVEGKPNYVKIVPDDEITVYHGGEKIDKIDLEKSNYSKTFFTTDIPEYAKQYASKYKEKGVVNKIKLKKDAKLIDIKNATPEQIIEIKNKIKQIQDEHVPYSGEGGFNQTFGNSVDELIDGARRGKSHYAEDPALVDVYKKLGYDGMVSYEDTGMRGKNIGIWNDKIIKPEIENEIQEVALKDLVKSPGTADEFIYHPLENTAKSKVAVDIEKQAIEAKLTKEFQDIAGYNPTTVAEQSEKMAFNLVNNLDVVKQITRGEIPLPKDINEGYFIKAVEDFAVKNGDVALLQDLASSPITSETSHAAQTLRLLQERDPYSPLNLMKEVQKTREKARPKNIKSPTEKVKLAKEPKIKSWESFVKEIPDC